MCCQWDGVTKIRHIGTGVSGRYTTVINGFVNGHRSCIYGTVIRCTFSAKSPLEHQPRPTGINLNLQADSTSSRTETTAGRWNVPEAMATWFVPGLGHFLIGEKKRGAIFFVCISMLWFGGLLIGGPSVIDWYSQSVPIVRKGQYGLFQTFAFEMVRTRYMQPVPPGMSTDEISRPGRIAYRPSLNRLEEQGVLYASVAGLLNILLIIDVVHRGGGGPTREEREPS